MIVNVFMFVLLELLLVLILVDCCMKLCGMFYEGGY